MADAFIYSANELRYPDIAESTINPQAQSLNTRLNNEVSRTQLLPEDNVILQLTGIYI